MIKINNNFDMVRPILRKIRQYLYRTVELFIPYVTKRQYLGFVLFYIKGPGIIDRIRFLSPTKIYEPKLCERIVKELNLKESPVFLDIGANLGLISLYVYKHSPQTTIYAIEPGLQQRSLLGLTATYNNLTRRLHLSSYAVSDQNGHASFTTYENATDGAGDGLLSTGRVPNPTREILVETIKLDKFVLDNQLKSVDVIKIDIEGAELLAFSGGREIISLYKPIIFFELNKLNLKNYKHSALDTINYLHNLNYRIYDLDGLECTENSLESLLQKDDVFIAQPS